VGPTESDYNTAFARTVASRLSGSVRQVMGAWIWAVGRG